MLGGFIWVSLFSTLLVLGFAYILWILANKEAGAVKTTGLVIAGAIALLAVIFFVISLTWGGQAGPCGMMGGMGMMGEGKMDRQKMMDMMKDYQKEMPKMHKRDNR